MHTFIILASRIELLPYTLRLILLYLYMHTTLSVLTSFISVIRNSLSKTSALRFSISLLTKETPYMHREAVKYFFQEPHISYLIYILVLVNHSLCLVLFFSCQQTFFVYRQKYRCFSLTQERKKNL